MYDFCCISTVILYRQAMSETELNEEAVHRNCYKIMIEFADILLANCTLLFGYTGCLILIDI